MWVRLGWRALWMLRLLWGLLSHGPPLPERTTPPVFPQTTPPPPPPALTRDGELRGMAGHSTAPLVPPAPWLRQVAVCLLVWGGKARNSPHEVQRGCSLTTRVLITGHVALFLKVALAVSAVF